VEEEGNTVVTKEDTDHVRGELFLRVCGYFVIFGEEIDTLRQTRNTKKTPRKFKKTPRKFKKNSRKNHPIQKNQNKPHRSLKKIP